MDARTDASSEDYRKVRAVIDKALDDLKALGAELDPVAIPDLIERIDKAYNGNVFETEPAINNYLSQHAQTRLSGRYATFCCRGMVMPSRARVLMNSVGKSTDDAGYVQVQPGPRRTCDWQCSP